jgi:hypothetical protein
MCRMESSASKRSSLTARHLFHAPQPLGITAMDDTVRFVRKFEELIEQPLTTQSTNAYPYVVSLQGKARSGRRGVRARDLAGAIGGLAGLFALLATVSASSHVLSGFSNRRGNGRRSSTSIFATAAVESQPTMKGGLGMVHARNVVESAAKEAGVCYGKGSKDVY